MSVVVLLTQSRINSLLQKPLRERLEFLVLEQLSDGVGQVDGGVKPVGLRPGIADEPLPVKSFSSRHNFAGGSLQLGGAQLE